MKFSLAPLTGRRAALWAAGWFAAATVLSFTIWRPIFSLLPFTLYFAAMAVTAARSGPWFGLASALGSILVVFANIEGTTSALALRAVGLLANSALVIWLGALLRRGATESSGFRESMGDAVSDFLWTVDRAGRPEALNARALEYIGLSLPELQERGWPEVVHAEDRLLVEKIFRLPPADAKQQNVELRLRRHDGQYFWFGCRFVPVTNAQGECVRWIGTSTNIDDRKRVEFEREELLISERKARDVAEHASRMKDEFVATLSHELRTPLNAITGWLHLLGEGAHHPAELREGLEVITRNTRLQAQLIDDLLDMNRIITGKLRLDVQSVRLPDVIEAALASIRPSAESKGIRLHSVLDPATGAIRGDPARLQQIIWNLLSNSVKFTPKGGRVEVLLERIESHVEITVSDSGAGIDPDFLPWIFERFRQADGGTTRRHAGLGLGLAIARQLAELHGGTIVAASSGLGHGSTFRVILPLPAATTTAEEEDRTHPSAENSNYTSARGAKLAGVKVLVVDDEPDSREIVRRILQSCGAEVTTAASASEGLAALSVDGFSVLVSDIGMPEMDGFEFVRQLRTSDFPSARSIPAIALTAFARSEDRRRAMQSGFDVFVSKPVDAPELTAVVERCASRGE